MVVPLSQVVLAVSLFPETCEQCLQPCYSSMKPVKAAFRVSRRGRGPMHDGGVAIGIASYEDAPCLSVRLLCRLPDNALPGFLLDRYDVVSVRR